MVKAAATAVFCTSTALIVGAGSAPHALIIMVIATRDEKIVKRFMIFEILLIGLAVGVTSALGDDAIVPYDN